MKNKKLYVFDLDNTLVYTDLLNNMSYLFAIDKLNLENRIETKARITRDDIYIYYSDLPNNIKTKLIEIKQKYFVEHLDKTALNIKLLELLCKIPVNNCILWTSAEQKRTKAILDYYDLTHRFCEIIYTPKKDVKTDIENICKKFNCNKDNLIIFDDDPNVSMYNNFIYYI